MIEIRNVQTIDGHRIDHCIKSDEATVIDAEQYMLFPGLIDPHVHFRVPGAEHKETWETGAMAAIAGGVTTVFDMPNNSPASSTAERIQAKIDQIEQQLQQIGIPLRYGLYLGADRRHLEEIPKAKANIIGLKIYMGSSTGDLRMDDRESLEKAFEIAAKNNVLVAVHAEDEQLIELHRSRLAKRTDPAVHSQIRSPDVAAKAVELAIKLAKHHNARLYIVHVSSREELSLIRQAKKEGLCVYAEAAPHHLFLTDHDYKKLGTKALVNPPLRTEKDREALWEAICDETIDTIGTDHAPHTLEEKNAPYGVAPSGFPSIELYFPLLLNAFHERKISLKSIVSLTSTRAREIFSIPCNEDVVLVDMNCKKTIDHAHLKTKAKWSPYAGRTAQGWPRYTILKGRIYDIRS